MRRIVKANADFFSRFESPEYRTAGAGFSRQEFEETIRGIVVQPRAGSALDALLSAGVVKPVAGTAEFGLERFIPSFRIQTSTFEAPGGEDEYLITCTDSPVVDRTDRVFPWSDEGEEVFRCVLENWHWEPPTNILDICTGAGTAGLLLGSHWKGQVARIVGLDSSHRALDYAVLNAKLNDVDTFQPRHFDLKSNDSLVNQLGSQQFDLVSIDPPFTPMPQKIGGYFHSSSAEVIKSALHHGLKQVKPGGMIVLLCYAYGSKEAPTSLQKILDSVDLSGFEAPVLSAVSGDVWRIDGEKQVPLNPMPVEYMAFRYGDPDWHPRFVAANYSVKEYVMWIESLKQSGMTHVHYITVVLRAKR